MNVAKGLRAISLAFAICLIGAPIAFAATIGLLPLWSWVESRFAIESLGHSGPAMWCYLASYAFILICAAVIWLALRRRSAVFRESRN